MTTSNKEVYQKLVERLSTTKMDAQLIEKVSHHLATTHQELVNWEEYFPCGIVAPDALCARGRISTKDLGHLEALLSIEDLVKIEVFPVGIILPEYFMVDATFAQDRVRSHVDNIRDRFQR